jgi:hypothetical protein
MTWLVRQWIAATVAIAATGLMVGLAIAAMTGVDQGHTRMSAADSKGASRTSTILPRATASCGRLEKAVGLHALSTAPASQLDRPGLGWAGRVAPPSRSAPSRFPDPTPQGSPHDYGNGARAKAGRAQR